MKISKTIQRRTIVLASIAALIALFHIAHYTVQLIYSTNPYRGIDNHTYIGELDTSFRAYDIKEVYEDYAITIERDAEGKPLVEAVPSSLIFFSKNPNYSHPDHFGWKANRVMVFMILAVFIVMVALCLTILIMAIKGFRTGNIFRRSHPCLIRWLALASFIYTALVENRAVFTQLATKEVYGINSPIEVFGSVSFSSAVVIAPALLLIFAELMKVAAQINEDEAMTI